MTNKEALRKILDSIEDLVFHIDKRSVRFVDIYEGPQPCDFDGSEVYKVHLHLELGPYNSGEDE